MYINCALMKETGFQKREIYSYFEVKTYALRVYNCIPLTKVLNYFKLWHTSVSIWSGLSRLFGIIWNTGRYKKHRNVRRRTSEHWATSFSQRSRVSTGSWGDFPWDTFRPIFQPGAGDRLAGVYTRILPFDPLSFARLSRPRPPLAPVFPRLTPQWDDGLYAPVYPQSMSIVFAEGCKWAQVRPP